MNKSDKKVAKAIEEVKEIPSNPILTLQPQQNIFEEEA
jgi:hypothetical protein